MTTTPASISEPDQGLAAKPVPHHSGAWRSAWAWAFLLGTLALTLGVDLLSKEFAFRYVAGAEVVVDRQRVLDISRNEDPRAISQLIIPAHKPRVVVPELLHFTLVINPGAVFGIGPGHRMFFMAFTLVALAFGVFMFANWTSPRDFGAHFAIGLLIGGGLGNLYDRLFKACVRDFIHPLPGWKWPNGWKLFGDPAIWPYVSNLADLFLLIGILMLLAHLWRKDRSVRTAAAA